MRIRIQLFTSMWIRILLIKVMLICDHWSTDLLVLHLSVHGTPWLRYEPRKFLNFDFNADPDPAFHSNVDLDPASKNNADPDPKPRLFHIRSSNMYLICGSPLMRYFIFTLACKLEYFKLFF
jgi:hypothetical protein